MYFYFSYQTSGILCYLYRWNDDCMCCVTSTIWTISEEKILIYCLMIETDLIIKKRRKLNLFLIHILYTSAALSSTPGAAIMTFRC